MKFKTLQPITYTKWLEQAGRFTRGKDSLITRNLPENTDKSGIAEIHVDIIKPLLNGFQAIITYKQYFTKTVEVSTFDRDLNPDGETNLIDIDNLINVISYQEQMDYATINSILQQIDPLIDPSIVGLDRLKATVARAILLNVVQHKTFELQESDWEIIN